MGEEIAQEFADFLYETPTPYNYCEYMRALMKQAGYVELKESEKWDHIPDKFFVTRRDRAFCAINKVDTECGVILGSHSDSSTLKVCKEFTNEGFQQLEVAPYDGGLWYGWIDRELRLAGKVFFMQDEKLKSKIINAKDTFAYIPGVACHLVKNHTCTPQYDQNVHFRPIIGKAGSERLIPKLAEYVGCSPEDVIDFDISLHPVQKATVVGVDNEFIAGAKIDDSVSVFAATKAFLSIDRPEKGLLMHVVFDNEEVGSGSDCGAKSNFIQSILARIGVSSSFYARSCLGSIDVVHAAHPNKTNLSDGGFHNLGDGVGYGWSASMCTVSDHPGLAILKAIAEREGVPLTPSVGKNSKPSGSTIGPHITSQLGLNVLDFSVPTISMHSVMETTTVRDITALMKLLKAFMKHYFEYE